MVASTKSRKITNSVNVNLSTNSSNIRNADGRRQIIGLSQAIREKAFQSTSPRSEETSCPATNINKQSSPITGEKSNELSLEDKFRNLFNSDTEEATNLLKLKNRSKAYSINAVARPSSENKLQDRISFFETDSDKIKAKRTASRVNMDPQRRCTSAIPSTHNGKEWNKISSGPYLSSNKENHSKPSPNTYVNLQWNHEDASTFEYMPRPNSAVPYQNSQKLNDNGPGANYKPVPSVRKSLYLDKSASEQKVRLDLNSKALDFPQRLPSSFHSRPNNYVQENALARSTPMRLVQPNPQQQRTGLHETRPLNEKLIYLPKNPTFNGSCQVTLRQAQQFAGPVPASRAKDYQLLPQSQEITPKENSNSTVARVSSVLVGQPYPRDYYPKQNFSFRRAVHRTLSSDKEKLPNDTKRILVTTTHLPQRGDKGSRKSDDRDSGTVVEPEASVFDFDSSVLSEGEKVVNQHNRVQSSDIRSEDESGTCTPVLPLLTTEDEFTDVVEEDKQTTLSANHKQLKNKESPSRTHVNSLQVTTVGGAELSTTESAIHEAVARKLEQKSVFGPAKPRRVTSSTRRNYYGKIPSSDEKRQKKTKTRRRRNHEDSDVTDCSSHRASCRQVVDRPNCNCNQSYQNPYCSCLNLANNKSEHGDTSSVRSMTTTSVCSSVLRRSGSRRRHHHRKCNYGGSEKHAREIRSLKNRVMRMEADVVSLARSLAQLSEFRPVRQQKVSSLNLEQLQQQIHELRTHLVPPEENSKTQKSIKSTVGMKSGNLSRKNKLKFFKEQQPPLLNLFLKELGYEKYVKNFENESIGMMELPYLDEKRLQDLGIPLGPRIRIMKEAQKSSYV